MVWRIEKSLAIAGNWTTIPLSFSQYPSHYANHAILALTYKSQNCYFQDINSAYSEDPGFMGPDAYTIFGVLFQEKNTNYV